MSSQPTIAMISREIVSMVAIMRSMGEKFYKIDSVEGAARCWHALTVQDQTARLFNSQRKLPSDPALPMIEVFDAMVGGMPEDEKFAAFHLRAAALAKEKALVWPANPAQVLEHVKAFFMMAMKGDETSNLPRSLARKGRQVTIEQVFALTPDRRIEPDGDVTIREDE